MKRRLYVVYDEVAEESAPVFEAINDGVARRMFDRLLEENTRNDQSFNRGEYSLLYIGEIDKSNNVLIKADVVREVNIKLSMVDEMEEENVGI